MSRCRNWCFTLNNPTDEDKDFWDDIMESEIANHLQYVVMQEEVGESGTIHLQGYIEMKQAFFMSRMKSLFGQRYHFERRRGSQSQAIDYCKKEESSTHGFICEFGIPKRTGVGGKFGDAVKALKSGKSIADVQEEFTEQYVMYKDKLTDYALKLKGGRNWAMDIQIYVGASGTGKSYTAQQNDNIYVCAWPTGGRWWWGDYRGEHTVVMDEFRHQIKMDVMLKMMDRYTWHLEAKGRSFQFSSKVIIITTNIDPRDWYPNLSIEKKAPLARRINEFATIWDFEAGEYPNFVKTRRPGEFQFNHAVRLINPIGGGYNAGGNWAGHNFGAN